MTPIDAVVVTWDGPHPLIAGMPSEPGSIHLVWGRYRTRLTLPAPAVLFIGVGGPGRASGAHLYRHPLNRYWHGTIRSDPRSVDAAAAITEWLFVELTGATHAPDRAPVPPARSCVLVNDWPTPDPGLVRRGRTSNIANRIPALLSWSAETGEFQASSKLLPIARGSL